jgi:hypothetical protein
MLDGSGRADRVDPQSAQAPIKRNRDHAQVPAPVRQSGPIPAATGPAPALRQALTRRKKIKKNATRSP